MSALRGNEAHDSQRCIGMEVVRKVGTVAVRAAVVSEVVKEGTRAVVEVMEAAATVEAAMVVMVGSGGGLGGGGLGGGWGGGIGGVGG